MTGLRIAAALLLHLCLYWACGVVLKACRRRIVSQKCGTGNGTGRSLSQTVVTGCFAWYTLFELVALPCVFLGVSTRRLSFLCLGWMVLLLFAGFRLEGRTLPAYAKAFCRSLKDHGWGALCLGAAFLALALTGAMYTDGSQDAAYYIGVAATAVFTNRLGRYGPYTGKKLYVFNPRYVFSTYPYHNSVCSVLTGLPVIVQARLVMPVVHAIVFTLVMYRMGRFLFREKSKRYADLFAAAVIGMYYFCNTSFQPGAFLLTRLYEGKALIANLALPGIVLVGLRLWEKIEDTQAWILLFLCCGSAVCFSGSCAIAGLGSLCAVLPALVRHKKPKKLLLLLIGTAPVLCWMAAYYLAKHGVISTKIRW